MLGDIEKRKKTWTTQNTVYVFKFTCSCMRSFGENHKEFIKNINDQCSKWSPEEIQTIFNDSLVNSQSFITTSTHPVYNYSIFTSVK